VTKTEVQPASVAELEAAVKDEKVCEVKRINRAGKVLETCSKPAAWVEISRCCGYVRFTCERHHLGCGGNYDFYECRGCHRRFEYFEQMITATHRI
jgi:hypothetical protein